MQEQDFDNWLQVVREGNDTFRHEVGRTKLAAFRLAANLLAAPRAGKALAPDRRPGSNGLQLPWMPLWPGLAASPVHDPASHPWTALLRDACAEIRRELFAVRADLTRAEYDSDLNPKPWNTYYIFLRGEPIREHLAACPVTASLLARIPHNGLHVCFSAIEPGGSLHPHTGPTNTSLTAHLGLAGCNSSRLIVAGHEVHYREGEVLVFDDSFVHHVENTGGDVRYTLMITFWHPALAGIERAFLSRVLRLGPG
jgi:aspartyl/asparaginyl beta-hydroxylase (cupin superfamily)